MREAGQEPPEDLLELAQQWMSNRRGGGSSRGGGGGGRGGNSRGSYGRERPNVRSRGEVSR